MAAVRIGFLGPLGTFTEEALLTQPDLASAELVPMRSMPDVLEATERGDVEFGFVALENSIDGTVNESLDGLVFENDLLIQREVVIGVHLNLLVPPGTAIGDVKRVVSFPKAIAQCRGFLARELPEVEEVAATSTTR